MLDQRVSVPLVLTITAMAVSAVFLTYGLLSESKTIYNQGNVNAVGVGVYHEYSCTNDVSTIDWGLIEPGSSKNVTIYVRNEGNIPVRLSMTVDGWEPEDAEEFLFISWDREGEYVNTGSKVRAVFTLSISEGISDIASFSFEITIVGSE